MPNWKHLDKEDFLAAMAFLFLVIAAITNEVSIWTNLK